MKLTVTSESLKSLNEEIAEPAPYRTGRDVEELAQRREQHTPQTDGNEPPLPTDVNNGRITFIPSTTKK